jgi:hypothetical protein
MYRTFGRHERSKTLQEGRQNTLCDLAQFERMTAFGFLEVAAVDTILHLIDRLEERPACDAKRLGEVAHGEAPESLGDVALNAGG